MSKSVYSLVLTDDVIEAIDRLAYAHNTSRSNMINQILADYVSYVTPEKKMRSIFDGIERQLTGGNEKPFQVMMQPSESMFSLRSALAYKYNPTVRYSVEIYRTGTESDAVGELRVSLRTQNGTLISVMTAFFRLWANTEQKTRPDTDVTVEDGRLIRRLSVPGGELTDALGENIAAYIEALDNAMKTYFKRMEMPSQAGPAVEKIYASYLERAKDRLV